MVKGNVDAAIGTMDRRRHEGVSSGGCRSEMFAPSHAFLSCRARLREDGSQVFQRESAAGKRVNLPVAKQTYCCQGEETTLLAAARLSGGGKKEWCWPIQPSCETRNVATHRWRRGGIEDAQ